MEKPQKADMLHEIEKLACLSPAEYEYSASSDDSVVIDFMSYTRGQNLNKKPQDLTAQRIFESCRNMGEGDVWTFGMMITEGFARILNSFRNVRVFHIIFDSYIEGSLKGGERSIRLANAKGVIHLAAIYENTKVPEQMEKFWVSESNKRKFQSLAKSALINMSLEVNKEVVVSGTVEDDKPLPALHLNDGGQVEQINELKLDNMEEADMRIMPHILWDVINFSRKSLIVVSEDTDVVILLLFYYKEFQQRGLEKIFIKLGRSDNKRMLPIHEVYTKLGYNFCKGMLKAHLGTGCDYLSKVGTKLSAVKADPTVTLARFGEGATLDDHQVDIAEEYLVKVASSNTGNAKTFDELRVTAWRRTNSVLGLPPTSHSVREGKFSY